MITLTTKILQSNRAALLLLFTGIIISLSSCKDCEDKTLQVNDNLLNWLPYTADETVTFISQDNDIREYTIAPDVDTQIEPDEDCTTTSIKPFIVMENSDQPEFLRIWFQYDEDLLGDREQIWAIAKEEDVNIASGALVEINNPDLVSETVTLNGRTFDEVVSFTINENSVLSMTIYLSKNIGLVGFDHLNYTWSLEE